MSRCPVHNKCRALVPAQRSWSRTPQRTSLLKFELHVLGCFTWRMRRNSRCASPPSHSLQKVDSAVLSTMAVFFVHGCCVGLPGGRSRCRRLEGGV